LENYLFSAIRNATIDYLKRQIVADKYRSYQSQCAEANCNSTEEMVDLQDLRDNLEKGLKKLPRKAEKIFRLNKIDNWPVKKIARHLGLSEKTVHYHITRSKKFIRSFLKEFRLSLLLLFLSVS
jgi:RNA polymerase sigma-70 factor (ECF subfamily)